MNVIQSGKRRGTPDFPFEALFFHPAQVEPAPTLFHWHPEIELLYAVGDGDLEVNVNDQHIIIGKGDIYILSPEDLHNCRALHPDTEYWSFLITPELFALSNTHFFQQDYWQPLLSKELVLPHSLDRSSDSYRRVLQQLEFLRHADPNEPQYKLSVFLACLTICSVLFPLCIHATPLPEGQRKTQDRIRSCILYLHLHYREHLSLSQIASSVHLHPNYLCRIFKAYTSQSIFDYLNHYRIERSKPLLRNHKFTVNQVAELSGFHSIEFFSRKFKLITGLTPSAYRKQP